MQVGTYSAFFRHLVNCVLLKSSVFKVMKAMESVMLDFTAGDRDNSCLALFWCHFECCVLVDEPVHSSVCANSDALYYFDRT